jgi:hypothetical protein
VLQARASELSSSSADVPRHVHLRLHQESADPYETRKLVQISHHYLFDVGILCAEWKMTREAIRETHVTILCECLSNLG